MMHGLPTWAVVSLKRREHIERVVAMLSSWAATMELSGNELCAWRDAGYGHDALRDVDETTLRKMTDERDLPSGLLHGPAAAIRFASDGETREDVLDAIRWHTVGSAQWSRVGRALYMADFLEPGRAFLRADRAYLADNVPQNFDGTFRQVVRMRMEWIVREGKPLHAATVTLWNSLQ